MVHDELEKLTAAARRIRVQSYQRGDGITSLQAPKISRIYP